jgi:ketosteroid isomerase-like protein
MFRILTLLAAVSLPMCGLAAAKSANSRTIGGEAEIQQFLTSFVRAFDDLDWAKFRSCFDDDASVFYPEFFPRRVEGVRNLQRSWQTVFENIKTKSGKSQAPYMALKPVDVRVQLLNDIAVVTFHLEHGGTAVGRRTLVLRKRGGQWRIVHLHASNVDFEEQGK